MRCWGWVCAAVMALGAPAAADEVLEQIETAVGYYEAGDLDGAVSELQFAIEAIRAQTGDLYAGTFPEPPAGWTAGEVEPTAGLPGLAGQMFTRTYAGPDGAAIEAQLMVDNPMMQGFAMMLQNPAIMAAQPNAERVRLHRENAMLTWPGDGTGELTMLVGGRALLRAEGRSLAEQAALVDLMEGWDVAGLRAAMGG